MSLQSQPLIEDETSWIANIYKAMDNVQYNKRVMSQSLSRTFKESERNEYESTQCPCKMADFSLITSDF
jgi:hypothetical protein